MCVSTALVTGGNRGIGLELVRQLAQKDIFVFMGSRDLKKGEEVRKQLGNEKENVRVIQLDVADSSSILNAKNQFQSSDKELDFLVNCAGILLNHGVSALNTEFSDIQLTFDINVQGALRVSQAFIPLMKRGGRVLNVSSGMGQLSDMGSGALAYRISKASLNVLTRVLANELHSDNISVNSVCPGWVKTDMGGPAAIRPVDQAVGSILQFLLAEHYPTGVFVRDGEPIPW